MKIGRNGQVIYVLCMLIRLLSQIFGKSTLIPSDIYFPSVYSKKAKKIIKSSAIANQVHNLNEHIHNIYIPLQYINLNEHFLS